VIRRQLADTIIKPFTLLPAAIAISYIIYDT